MAHNGYIRIPDDGPLPGPLGLVADSVGLFQKIALVAKPSIWRTWHMSGCRNLSATLCAMMLLAGSFFEFGRWLMARHGAT